MKRQLAKLAFVGTLLIADIALITVIRELWLPERWMGGLGAGIGTLILITAPKLFDRTWPKPMQGWSE